MKPTSGQPAPDPEKEKDEIAKAVDEEEQRPWRKNMKKVEDHINGNCNFIFNQIGVASSRHFIIKSHGFHCILYKSRSG